MGISSASDVLKMEYIIHIQDFLKLSEFQKSQIKEEENRNTMLRIEEGKRQLVKEEVKKLSDMDDVMAVIMGISAVEVI
jgi:nitrate reductase NapAB chaperone NapD